MVSITTIADRYYGCSCFQQGAGSQHCHTCSIGNCALQHHGGSRGCGVVIRCCEEPLRTSCPDILLSLLFLVTSIVVAFSVQILTFSGIILDPQHTLFGSVRMTAREKPRGQRLCLLIRCVPMALHRACQVLGTQQCWFTGSVW